MIKKESILDQYVFSGIGGIKLRYKVKDNVSDEIHNFINYNELRDYAHGFKNRLNEDAEANGNNRNSIYKTNCFEEIHYIFDICNLDILEIE